MGVNATDEEKERGAMAPKNGDTGVKASDEENGAAEEVEGTDVLEKGEKAATSADEENGGTAEGKGKLSEEAELELLEEAEWKWRIAAPADGEEEPKPMRERRRWRSTRREAGAAADTEREVTAPAAKELAVEKPIFFFSAAAVGNKIDLVSSEGKLSEEAVCKLSEEAEWKWKIATPADEGEGPTPRRERRRLRVKRRMINLVSSEGIPFKMSEEAARLWVLLADMIDDGCAGGTIPLRNVDARALATVIKYCDKHAAAAKPNSSSHHDAAGGAGSSSSSSLNATESEKKTLAEWDRKLVDDLTQDALYDLIQAANFLDVKGLLEATCQKVADMIKGKTPAQIRSIFHIANEFTKEEEAEMREESPWAFED
nr:unnamed protein product [Digitaria exilis]